MKYLVFILLFAISVFAQEADSYAPAQQYAPAQYGQPNQYPPQQQYAPAQYPAQYPNQNPAQYPAQQPYYAPAPYPVAQPQYPPQYYQQVFYDDSVAYYQNLIERYSRSGNSMRRGGNAMMIVGGISLGVGILTMATSVSDASRNCYYDDYSCKEERDDAEKVALVSELIAIGGGAVFATGLVLKIIGGSKLRKADRYQNILMQYNYRRQHALQLEIKPLINARKGSYGSRLSLNF